MHFLKIFHLSLYALVFAASAILAAAEGGYSPALATFVIGAVAYFFNDCRNQFSLSEYWANALAVAVFCIAAIEFDGNNREAQLLSGTHLLVYLLWIVLLWRRDLRHYWYVCALCLLQVAVASILTQASWFGIALVGYVTLSIWTFALFSVIRAEYAVKSYEAEVSTSALWIPWFTSKTNPRNHPDSRVRGQIQDQGKGFVNTRLVAGLLFVSLLSLSTGSVVFALIPRSWEQRPDSSMTKNRSNRRAAAESAVTGFSEQVRLGDIGEILESSEPVLTMQIVDGSTGQPLDVLQFARAYGMSEPYLRGAVLVNYNSEENTWTPSSVANLRQMLVEPLDSLPNDYVSQEFTLEALGMNRLFVMRPYFVNNHIHGEMLDPEIQLFCDLHDFSLSRSSDSGRVQYRVSSIKPTLTQQALPLAQRPLGDFRSYRSSPSNDYRLELTAPPGSRLRRLKNLAQRIEASLETPAASRGQRAYALARALESHLRDSGEYTYTLDASVSDPNIDPLEDFLFNRKSGHCEYYASALTMMLRSVGIPAQLINGFKGGEYNDDKKILYVEQRHAHSWVEAFVNGQWLILDPTPSIEREKMVAANKPGEWESLTRKLWRLWNEHVLGLSFKQQRRDFFQPILNYLQVAFSSTEGMRSALADFWNWFRDTLSSPRKWFSFDGGMAAFLILATPVLLFQLCKKIWQYLMRKARQRRGASRRSARRIEFYERFLKLAEQRGLVRQPQQTQREFGDALQHSLEPLLNDSGLKNLGDSVAESFYRVRFGDEQLSAEEEQRINNKLQAFEAALRQQAP